jgi:NAD(P)-dependent dehydrogenase (short-subunit alcohol dehydrogenase family)
LFQLRLTRATGIGRSTALSFARDGCVKLHLGDLNTNGLEETRKLIKVDYPNAVIHVARVDISDEQSVQDFYDGAITNFGRIDFAANVAGYAHAATEVTAIDETMYELSYKVNQRGVRFLVFQVILSLVLTRLPRRFSARERSCVKCSSKTF